jgi:hypothetical protein
VPPLGPANFIAREGRVSASEVAALMPEGHPYLDARDVWDRVAGLRLSDDVLPNAAMRIGAILEPAILEAAADLYSWRVRANGRTLIHPTLPLVATPDGYVLNARELVEVKWSGNPTGWINLPAHVYWQVQAQLMCAPGFRAVWVVALAGRMKRWRVERNATASRRIARAVRSLMDSVADGAPPEHLIRDRSTIEAWNSDTPRSLT